MTVETLESRRKSLFITFTVLCSGVFITYVLNMPERSHLGIIPLIIFVSLCHFLLRAGFYRLLTGAKYSLILKASLLAELMADTLELPMLSVFQTGFLRDYAYFDYVYVIAWLLGCWVSNELAFKLHFPQVNSATWRNQLALLAPSVILLLLIAAVVYGLNHGYLHK